LQALLFGLNNFTKTCSIVAMVLVSRFIENICAVVNVLCNLSYIPGYTVLFFLSPATCARSYSVLQSIHAPLLSKSLCVSLTYFFLFFFFFFFFFLLHLMPVLIVLYAVLYSGLLMLISTSPVFIDVLLYTFEV
jgi:hypothetical protein